MKGSYYKITVHINGRIPLQGIRFYPTVDNDEAYELAKKSLLKYYYLSDIIAIDIWPLSSYSVELQEYLAKVKQNEQGKN